jgi:hypothetical protein
MSLDEEAIEKVEVYPIDAPYSFLMLVPNAKPLCHMVPDTKFFEQITK